MSTINLITSRRTTRLDVFDYNVAKNDKIYKYVDLTNFNASNVEFEHKLKNIESFDHINSIDFDKQSTLTYHIVEKCKSIICYTSLSNVVLYIKLSDYGLVDNNFNNLKIFYNYELNVFTIDGIFQHNTLISLNISKNIFFDTEDKNLVDFNIRKNALKRDFKSTGIYQVNNFFNIITLKSGGMLLAEKHLDVNNIPMEYTFHEHDVAKPLTPFLWIPLTVFEHYSPEGCIQHVGILPNNHVLTISKLLETKLYRLDTNDQGQVTNRLALLSTFDLTLLHALKDKVVKKNELNALYLRDFKVTQSPDFTKLALYYMTHGGASGYVFFNYDVQSDSVSLEKTLNFISEIESPVIKPNYTKYYQMNSLRITDDLDIFAMYDADSFSRGSGHGCIEHIVMKYSDKKWKEIYSSNGINNVGFGLSDASDELDVVLYIANVFNLSKNQVLKDLKDEIHNASYVNEYITKVSNEKSKFTGSPSNILFNASSMFLPGMEYAYSGLNSQQLHTYFVPKFIVPVLDESGFLKSLNELFKPVDFENHRLLTYKIARECLKESLDTEAFKTQIVSKFDKNLFLDISANIQIPDCITAINKLIEYSIDIDVTSKYGNTIQEQQVLMEYVAYKNYELMVLYIKIWLFFTTSEFNNTELSETLKSLLNTLKKRFKFEHCFKFNKDIMFNIFIEDSPSLNLQSQQNLIVTSEYIVSNIIIDRYEEWTDKYQLSFLAKDKYTEDDLQLFTDFIQSFDVNNKIQSIVYLKLNDYEKVLETSDSEFKAMDLSDEVDEYDPITKDLLAASGNLEYLSILLGVFVNQLKNKEIAYRLATAIIDGHLSEGNDYSNAWVFYKNYLPLLAQDGKFFEVIKTMNNLGMVKNEDLFEVISELMKLYGKKYLKAVIRYSVLKRNVVEGNKVIPFPQFYMVKKITFDLVMNHSDATDITMMDYIKLMLSYEDTQQALNFLYALITSDDDYIMMQKYKVMMQAVLLNLPEDERYVLNAEGNVVGMDILSNI